MSAECIKELYLHFGNPKCPILNIFPPEKQCEELQLGFFFLVIVSGHLECIQITSYQTKITSQSYSQENCLKIQTHRLL